MDRQARREVHELHLQLGTGSGLAGRRADPRADVSTKYYDVSITSSDRFNFRPVSTERKSGSGCEPYSGGNPGFDITITRTRKHDGKALPDDVLTTKYDGDVDVICN